MRALLLVLALMASTPREAGATTCDPDGGQRAQVRAAFDASAVVFSAYVTEVTGSAEAPIARLKVLQVWKGAIDVGQVVEATASESVSFMSDGVVPSAGMALLVYASSGEPYMLHVCSRTRELDAATGDIPLLNKFSGKRNYRLGG